MIIKKTWRIFFSGGSGMFEVHGRSGASYGWAHAVPGGHELKLTEEEYRRAAHDLGARQWRMVYPEFHCDVEVELEPSDFPALPAPAEPEHEPAAKKKRHRIAPTPLESPASSGSAE